MAEKESPDLTCFVIMPISDVDGYDVGHFGRVYEFIIKPACNRARFRPIRADEVQVTNYIVVDILRKILDADMVVCDLSSRNSNVLYELGIRQAFNRPVTLIRDSRTPRIFDIQGLRDLEYDESLRIDKINSAVESLTTLLRNTSRLEQEDVNSIIQLLRIKPAQASTVELTTETRLVLDAISGLGERITRLEDKDTIQVASIPALTKADVQTALHLPNGTRLVKGLKVYHPKFGEGLVTSVTRYEIAITLDSGKDIRMSTGSIFLNELRGVSENIDDAVT
jgi:hypothetical protein